jgi:hypothetical protein
VLRKTNERFLFGVKTSCTLSVSTVGKVMLLIPDYPYHLLNTKTKYNES